MFVYVREIYEMLIENGFPMKCDLIKILLSRKFLSDQIFEKLSSLNSQ